ncbi:MAG: glycosyltransferase [Oligoflexia bacterium]|nr:glycosyltransferase [Oligoflexia bacterium]
MTVSLRGIQFEALIITRNRPKLLESCLNSIEQAKCGDFHLIVFQNGQDPRYSKLEGRYNNQSWVTWIVHNQPLSASAARNKAVKYVEAEWTYFLDDDVIVDTQIFKKFTKCLALFSEAQCVGGPNLNPAHSNLFQESSGLALSSLWGSFLSRKRYGSTGIAGRATEHDLILCNLAIKTQFIRQITFPENFNCGEENWVLRVLTQSGRMAYWCPELIVFHERRPNLISFARQVFQYGWGRAQNMRFMKPIPHWAHFVPSLFALFLFGLLGHWTLNGSVPYWAFVILGIYLLFTILFSAGLTKLTKKPKVGTFLTLGVVFPTIHISYGLGVIWGLINQVSEPGILISTESESVSTGN